MLTFLLKRLLAMIPTLLGITFVTFAVINFAPGDPVETTFGASGEGGKEAGGDSAGEARRSDSIKAKKKLLGFLTEDHTVGAWDADLVRYARPGETGDKYKRVPDLARRGDVGELAAWPRTLAFDARSGRIYTGLESGAVTAIDVGAGEARGTFQLGDVGVWAVAVAPDGSRFVAANSDGRVQIVTTADLRPLGDALELKKPVRDLSFLPDGAAFLSACDDGVIRLHDAATGKVQREFGGHRSYVAALQVARDGRRFYSGGYDRMLREWDLATGTARDILEHGQAIGAMALAPDGTFVVTGCDDGLVRVVSADPSKTGPAALRATLKGHAKAVGAVAVSPDAATVWSGSRDDTIRSWDVAAGEQTTQSPEATGRVHALLVSPDGRTLWSVAAGWRKVPVATRYANWLWKTVRFDFDRSFIDDQLVVDKIWDALPVTLGLNFLSILIIYAVSIPVGVTAAVRRGSLFDGVSSVVLFVLYSIPSFWLATLLIMGFSSKRHFDVFPSGGLHDVSSAGLPYLPWLADWGLHLVLPIVVLTYGGFAGLSRYMRTTMLETISQDYVRTARAKGLPERTVIYKHALRNSLVTVVTLVATLLPAMIGGSVIIEYIFNIPGMGKLGFDAIQQRDYPVIMAITTMSGVLTLLGILLSDILYTIVDPRISHQ